MSEISKEALYEQLKTSEPQINEVISKHLTDETVKERCLYYVGWLKEKGISPIYVDVAGQNPFWEINYGDKKHYMVWNGKDNISIMIKVAFTNKYQAVMLENNLQEMVFNNLQYCSRKYGKHCNNCGLPPDVAGVNEIIFGKEVENLCCGQFISFINPNSKTIEGIKKLLEL